MKRFAVLFGILAIAFACGTSYATAPQARDVPDIRLDTGGDTISDLPETATDAYDVFDYFKDVDDAPSALTASIRNIQAYLASPPAPNIDIGGATEASGAPALVDVYGLAAAGWWQYTVRVDDASTVAKGVVGADAISDVAAAKYSTFAVMEPTIDDGIFLADGPLGGQSRQFAYCYIGQATGQLYRLDVAIDPQSASPNVDWEVYVNDVVYDVTSINYDANGSWIGLDPNTYRDNGPAVGPIDGLYYAIDANGTLTLTTGGSIGAGPWLVGLLATNQSDAEDMDGSRILMANAMLPEATPYADATLGGSVTFDDLTPGSISAAEDRYVILYGGGRGNTRTISGVAPSATETIDPGCAWVYKMGDEDSFLDSVPLEIVDLSADTELPSAAQIVEDQTTALIAGGNAIKATLAPPVGTAVRRDEDNYLTSEQLQGFRLDSRAFTGIDPTDIITFSLSVATDAASSTDLPKYQIYLTSGLGGSIYGQDYRRINALLAGDMPRLDLPYDTDGWHTLSITYTPASTIQWFNLDGDTNMDEDDLVLLDNLAAPEGWLGRNELSVVKAGMAFSTTNFANNTVNVWLDNMRVYRSAFALDLALGPVELVDTLQSGENTKVDYLVGLAQQEYTTGDLAGDMESLASMSDAELESSGMWQGAGGGGPGAFAHPAKGYINGVIGNYAIGIYDHTRNAGSSQSITMTLSGTDGTDGAAGDLDAVRLHLSTGAVACSGDGLYCLEAYVSKLNVCNVVNTYRHPQVRVLLQEVAPNNIGTAGGAVLVNGGLPEAVTGDPPYNWLRVVSTMYIPDCEAIRGDVWMMDAFKADVNYFSVPVYVDDLKLYKIEDPAIFFDADLFDGV